MNAPACGGVTVKIDDAKLKERMRDLLADAWDDGYNEGTYDQTYGHTRLPNPYRDEAST